MHCLVSVIPIDNLSINYCAQMFYIHMHLYMLNMCVRVYVRVYVGVCARVRVHNP